MPEAHESPRERIAGLLADLKRAQDELANKHGALLMAIDAGQAQEATLRQEVEAHVALVKAVMERVKEAFDAYRS